jgi:hypothetical protein
MFSLTAFSQAATDSIPTKCFPVPVVKLIIKDLLKGDSAQAELKSVEKQLVLTEKKVSLKDSVISDMKLKEINYINIIDNQNKKYEVLEGYSKRIERQLKIAKVKNKFTTFISTGVIGVLAFFLITK